MKIGTARVLAGIGGAKMVETRDGALDHRAQRSKINLSGFTDVTEALSCGVFVLANRGEVTYVGVARGDMLSAIAAVRGDRPKWLPSVPFDQVLIHRCAPDVAAKLRAQLIAQYAPKGNAAPPSAPIALMERRL